MRVKRCLYFSFVVFAFVAVAPTVAEAKGRHKSGFVSTQVTFQVQNTNRSKLACGADGAAYKIRGYLTGPQAKVGRASRKRKPAATLYLHGLGFGEWFWHVKSPFVAPAVLPGRLDYAIGQATEGHVSVTIDRLGYDASDHPEGFKVCLGSQADIAHQIVQQLRAGTYTVTGRKPVHFRKVALAGHSIGAQIAMIEAYSFKDVDALLIASFSFQNLPRAQVALGPSRDACLAGGEPADPGGLSGYAYFGQPTEADYIAVMFRSAPPPAMLALRNRDPCGDIASIIPALIQQQSQLGSVKAPVLVICGTKDVLFGPLGCHSQADRFTASRHVETQLVRNAPHAITLDKGAPIFRRKVSRWLKKRGF
jgi:pimeloyl-ACP methyl ester carboxylesterase